DVGGWCSQRAAWRALGVPEQGSRGESSPMAVREKRLEGHPVAGRGDTPDLVDRKDLERMLARTLSTDHILGSTLVEPKRLGFRREKVHDRRAAETHGVSLDVPLQQ